MDGGPDILRLQGRITLEDLHLRETFRQVVEDHRNHDPGPGDADLAMTDIRFRADPLLPAHRLSPCSSFALSHSTPAELPERLWMASLIRIVMTRKRRRLGPPR